MIETLLGGICFLLILVLSYYYLTKTERKEKKTFFLAQVFVIVVFAVLCYLTDLVHQENTIVKLFFVLAIMFSFLGDLLMDQRVTLTGIKLIDGFTGFSLAHVLYITGMILWLKTVNFKQDTTTYVLLAVILLILIIGYGLTAFNFKNKVLRLVSVFYSLLLGGTLFFALLIFTWIRTLSTQVVLFGVILFFLSDFTLAYREAKKPVYNLDYFIHGSYILGQFLIQAGIFIF